MDENAQPGPESGRQLDLLLTVLQEEEAEFAAQSQEFEGVAQEQIERLTKELSAI